MVSIKLSANSFRLENITLAAAACLLLSGYLNYALSREIVTLIQAFFLVAYCGSMAAWIGLQPRLTTLSICAYIGILMVVCLVPNLIGSALPTRPSFSADKFIKVFIIVLSSACLGAQCVQARDMTKFFRWLGPLSLVLVILTTAFSAPVAGSGRLGNGAGNAIWYCRLVGLCLLTLMLTHIDSRRLSAILRLLLYGTCGLLLMLMAWSGSRGPILAMVTVLFFVNSGWIIKHPVRVVSAVTFGVFMAYASYHFGSKGIRDRFEALLFSNDIGDTDGGRTMVYKMCLRLFGEQPIGYGLGGFESLTDIDYPHNLLMECLVEPGILFTLLFFIPIGYAIVHSIRCLIRNTEPFPHYRLPCALCVYAFFNSMLSGDMTSPRMLYITTAFIVGVRMTKLQRKRKTALDSPPRKPDPDRRPNMRPSGPAISSNPL